LPDRNQGEGIAEVCFWVYRLGSLLFFLPLTLPIFMTWATSRLKQICVGSNVWDEIH
jgi:hypothetical protein